jgi:sialate O-acetylesterase
MIGSYWGGTRIEAWSRPTVLERCNIGPNVDEVAPKNMNSALWNGMIAPLTKLSVFGFLWYQGESNTNYNQDKYACSFENMIKDWRTLFRVPDAPFGFVQLSTVKYGDSGLTYPKLRWHQTADLGAVPNVRLEHVHMAVAIDTYDETNAIHPWYKQIVANRLAVTTLRNAYGLTLYPEHGPRVIFAAATADALLLTYSQAVILNNDKLSGFYYCCAEDTACYEAPNASSWPEVAKEGVALRDNTTVSFAWSSLLLCPDSRLPSLAYLWRETPIEQPVWGAPIYAADDFGLPAEPWIWLSADLPEPK